MADRPRAQPPRKGVVAQLGGPLGVAALAIGAIALGAYALDLHKHTCACGNTWRHLGAFNLGDESAHTCARCNTVQWWKDGWAHYAATGKMTDGAFPRSTAPSLPPPLPPNTTGPPTMDSFLWPPRST